MEVEFVGAYENESAASKIREPKPLLSRASLPPLVFNDERKAKQQSCPNSISVIRVNRNPIVDTKQ